VHCTTPINKKVILLFNPRELALTRASPGDTHPFNLISNLLSTVTFHVSPEFDYMIKFVIADRDDSAQDSAAYIGPMQSLTQHWVKPVTHLPKSATGTRQSSCCFLP
jgi:hypothetical protein